MQSLQDPHETIWQGANLSFTPAARMLDVMYRLNFLPHPSWRCNHNAEPEKYDKSQRKSDLLYHQHVN